MSEAQDTWAQRDYSKPAGPVAWAFEHCQWKVAVIIGPTGGGKSTAAARRILRAAQWQYPSPRDGERKVRVGVIAPTYRRLWDQVIKSYRKEINPAWKLKDGAGGWKGAVGDPAEHMFHVKCPDGLWARVEVLFRAVQDQDLEDFFRGFEVTAWWLPEMDTHANGDILSFAANRVGRYPEPEDRPELTEGMKPAYHGVWGDANAPEIDDWFFNRFWLPGGRMANDRVFIQPSGFSPNAENLQNLRKIDPDYYVNKSKDQEAWMNRRFLENKPGFSRHGLPVHDHFDIARHVIEQGIKIEPRERLIIGADCGNTLFPAATFNQRVMAQIRALREVNTVGRSASGMDLVEFAHEVRRERETTFSEVADAFLFFDPSALSRSVVNRQTTLAAVLQGELGSSIEIIPAPSNDPLARRSAMDQALKRSGAMPGEPGFVVDGKHCPELIKALSGAYHFAKRKGGQGGQAPTPNKVHPYCDIAESEQYAILGVDGLGEAVQGLIHDGHDRANLQDHGVILQE